MNSGLRYVSLGVFTTLVTYAIYLSLLNYLGPMVAYIMCLLAALFIQVFLMAPFVFKKKFSFKSAYRSFVVYSLYLCLYAFLMKTLLYLGVNPVVAPIFVIAVAAPVQFFAGRRWVSN